MEMNRKLSLNMADWIDIQNTAKMPVPVYETRQILPIHKGDSKGLLPYLQSLEKKQNKK